MKLKSPYQTLLLLLLALVVVIPQPTLSKPFFSGATYEVCFTPGENCACQIIQEIKQAKKQILVQAYVFSDLSIAQALIRAKQRGLDVKIILDKSQLKGKFTLLNFFRKHKISVVIGCLPGIAHNKIIIIDNDTVITGSYNYTRSATKRNAENLLIIKDSGLAKVYMQNWYDQEKLTIKRRKKCIKNF